MDKIGLKLKHRREEKRLSHEDINLALRTPAKYLRALEADDVSAFPAEVYYIGFMRRYAVYLGLDADELINAYKSEKTVVERKAAPADQEKEATSSARLWVIVIVVLPALTIAALVWLNYKVSETADYIPVKITEAVPRSAQTPAAPVKLKAAVILKKPVVQPAEIRPAATAIPAAHAAGKGFRLEVEALENAWIKVMTDGNVAYEAILQKGQKMEWAAEGKLGFIVGYAPGVKARLNGKELDVISGAKQDVNELYFNAQ